MFRNTAAATGAAILVAAPSAADARTFDVAPGTLGEVIVAVGIQARKTILLAQPGLASLRSPGVRGRLSLPQALAWILRGTGAQAISLPGGTWQIRRKKVPAVGMARPALLPPPSSAAADQSDIVVTASKQGLTLDRYPGSIKIIEPAAGWTAAHAAEGTMAITRLAPSLASTNLGAGRNKLFIRGIADSSFSGPTQATTGQFLGDIRLTYNSPDPDLNLYDMKRFEILAGPQGTLYGTGSLGGIVRMVPHTPDVNRFGATAAMGIGSTRSGGLSGDGAAMINLPLVSGHVAARLVVYGNHSAGYIDAPLQHRRNINSMTRHGARISLRAEDVAGWTIDAGGLMQNIASGDGQYVLRGSPPFMRGGLVPQPFENEYGLGYISVSREVGGARLVSVSSFARQRQSSVFDAAGLAGVEQPTRYTEDNDTALAYHETRLSGADPRKPWTAGVMLTSNISRLSISLGPVSQRNGSGGRRERQVEVALFGQMTHPLTRTTAVTFGGRLSFAHASQGLINVPLEDPTDATRDILRAFGTVGLNWNPRKALTFFYHYQQGYRPGGLGIFYADGALRSSRYAADELNIHEIGLRWGKASELLSGQAAIFSGRWDNIQADLIGEVGLPNTANIGRGAIKGLEAELNWRPFPSLLITGSFFLNDSRLVSYWTTPSAVDGGRLPNVAHSGAGGSVSWERRIQSNAMLTLEGAARYVGRSYLGVGSLQQIGQGNYLVIDIGAHWKAPRFGVALTISNLAGTRSNTFSYGNPFDLGRREQITPLRPRSIRLGLDFSF